ncbi:putative bifunctional diguanylate cyclase/phosphodiesterase [Halanaerobium hydrogeniformans]|uniref:Diguanylate cyclase/phosphodiesterase n=1 Tax=Halanaerobium hydrogeniformans TaxID=656519 RepID=E4RPV7_HALHG|nr:phosphodiesterase [Halanaerobium hydrogeniformans]ADQ14324.1 diguanylate cyclase/phosphodiesterase [Halanaerobium hydrogeniformans]
MKKNDSNNPVRKIVIRYFVFGILWILFSDSLAAFLFKDYVSYQQIQSVKGIAFVVITGFFLYYLLVSNFEEIFKKEEELYQQAYYDSLTSLPNKRYLDEELKAKIKKSQNNKNYNFAVFYINIENINTLMDIKGYKQTSNFIKKLADILKDIEKEDSKSFIANYNYSKFIIINNRVNKKKYSKKAEKILAAVQKLWEKGEIDYYLNINIGIAFYPDSALDGEGLISAAQIAAHSIENKKQNYRFFDQELYLRKLKFENLKQDLRTGLEKDEFSLVYQPKIRLSDKKIVSLEALIRWQHPDLGIISPAEFIPIAEKTHLIREIGCWVLDEVLKQISKWKNNTEEEIKVSINLSPLELSNPNKIKNIDRAFEKYKIKQELIEFEITENAFLDNKYNFLKILKQLKGRGFTIALDDFGSGYSSLNYLSYLPIDKLKIDKLFVDNLEKEKNQLLTQSIISLSHNLDLSVIAEGVETKEQLDLLEKFNCDQVQGYYFYKALSPKEIEKLLLNND